ncbi:TetR/AcrR family transcriptional regulator [Streptomyces sp. NPDC047061]|uniref:TetR/AcrR family transcriptional regulator n=1 Tax=Streptomyces sp. NPDC047061 TaxID=3154605 RepID=UPI0033CD8CEA
METSKPSPPRTRKRDIPLTEAGIYAAALRLIDTDGVEALSMRKLAAELSANPMSLYHHVPSKDALLRGVARTVAVQFRTMTPEGAPWQERIRLLATDFRALAHRHPKLMVHSFAQPDFVQPDEPFWAALTAALNAAGVPQPQIPRTAALLCAAVIGILTAELNGALHRWSTLEPGAPASGEEGPADAGADEDLAFRLALDMLVAGLESRLTATPDRSTPRTDTSGRGTLTAPP